MDGSRDQERQAVIERLQASKTLLEAHTIRQNTCLADGRKSDGHVFNQGAMRMYHSPALAKRARMVSNAVLWGRRAEEAVGGIVDVVGSLGALGIESVM